MDERIVRMKLAALLSQVTRLQSCSHLDRQTRPDTVGSRAIPTPTSTRYHCDRSTCLLVQSCVSDHGVWCRQAALDEYTLILSRNPEDSEALAMRGGVYMLDGNWEAAVHDYTASLDGQASAKLQVVSVPIES
eukprot:816752-Rhodomonas_salina.2